jgi:hypothetical protein
MKKNILVLLTVCSTLVFFAGDVRADDYVVSGNGEGSNSQVSVTNTNTATTTQTNTAAVDNNTNVSADTGNNEASSNTGSTPTSDTNITTGDATVTSNVTNDVNTSVVNNNNCCEAGNDTNVTVTGNGAGSTNTADITNTNTTTVTVTQNANITNNVNGSANTGDNQANNNGGSVSISTGDIHATDTIKNTGINVYKVDAGVSSGGLSVKIAGNGEFSQNSIKFAQNNDVTINISNNANIVNNSTWKLNTGRNKANGNLGDVIIATGDVYFDSVIENGPINEGWVTVECCKKDGDGEHPTPTPTPGPSTTPTPTPTPGGGGDKNNNNGGGGGDGRSDGASTSTGSPAVLAAMLPATGTMWMYLITLAGIMMFLYGWYLRLTSGEAPPKKAYA